MMIKKKLALAVALLFAVGAVKASTSQQSASASNVNLFRAAADTTLKSLESALTSEQLVYKTRLDSIKATVPLPYNSFVQKYIDIYASRGKQIAKSLGLAKYYFPIFDKGFKQFNIPDEIMFLSVVESSLNPQAVSRSGAAGPWQFMPATARLFGLSMDEFVDERRDPAAASMAAANYIRDAYTTLGDWLLAIAAYNCGQGAVTRAIKKAGNVYDFWAIREFLPVETQNYVPAFIATTYIMKYYQKHGIIPSASGLPAGADVVQVNKHISFASIAKATNVAIEQIAALNPIYTRQVINGSPIAPKILVLPALAVSSYQAVFEVLNGPAREVTGGLAVAVITTEPKAGMSFAQPVSDKKISAYRVK